MMGSLGVSLVAWVLVPILLFAIGLGNGLLVERATTFRLPNSLLAPVGICAATLIGYMAYRLGADVAVAAPLVAAAALAGFVLARSELPARISPGLWPALATLAVYALYVAPVVLAGGWTWTGYNFVNDTATQLLLADHLAHSGLSAPPGPPGSDPFSTGTEHVRIYLSTGYPVGSHGLLAVVATIAAVPFEAAYNPFMGALIGLAAMALAALGRRSGLSAPAAAGMASVAMAANLTYQYALQGNIKEIAMIATLATAVAVAREALGDRRPVAGMACLGVCVATAITVYSAAAVPYIGALALAILGSAFLMPGAELRRRLVPAALAGLGVAFVLALPALLKIVKFGDAAENVFASPQARLELGHLLRPLKLIQAAGIWLVGDYRGPVPDGRQALTAALIVLVVGLAAGGAVWSIRRREPGPLLYAAAAALTLAVIAPRTSPYADGKMLAILSPGVVILAAFGALGIARLWRPAAYALAAAAAIGVIWSDGFAYHVVQLAPIDRMKAMEDVGERLSKTNTLILMTEADEFAKYFMRDARVNEPTEAITPRQIKLRIPQGFAARWYDLDEYDPGYVQNFATLVTRRSPGVSRPPGNYARVYRNRYYEVWRRRASPRVQEHLGAYGVTTATAELPCADIRALASRAGRGERLLVARRPEEPRLDILKAPRTSAWITDPVHPGTVIPTVPGQVAERVSFEGGRYRIWVNGSFGRPVSVFVDDRWLGRAKGVDSPRQWHVAGEVELSGGRHSVEMTRGGGSLAPGDGFAGQLGPVGFERLAPESMQTIEPRDAGRLCGKRVDWVERVSVPRS
jgi:hypothetical protein